jgi:hypothetical protein
MSNVIKESNLQCGGNGKASKAPVKYMYFILYKAEHALKRTAALYLF